MDKIGVMLDLICAVVDDDSRSWQIKKQEIVRRCHQNERIENGVEEFFRWFTEEEEEKGPPAG